MLSPESMPLTGSMVAKVEAVVLQVPPVVGRSLSGIVDPAQTAVGPVIGVGDGLTVNVVVDKQPVVGAA